MRAARRRQNERTPPRRDPGWERRKPLRVKKQITPVMLTGRSACHTPAIAVAPIR